MDTVENDTQDTQLQGPGRLLTEARLKLGLDPQNVAEMLHLREYQVRALEADDFDNLPEPTYVKGYLRAYCQLLSLDPEKIIAMYTAIVAPPVRESFEGLATEKQAASNDNLVKLVSIVMIVLVAGLAITFWIGSRDNGAPDAEDNGAAQIAVNESQAVEETVPTTIVDEADSNQSTPETAGAAENVQTALIPQPPASVPSQTKSTPAPDVAEKTELTATAPEVSTEGIKKEVSLLPENDSLARTRLLLKVMQGSWVDVRDAKGNKLIYESVPAGREIPLEGLAPFSVFLGNAEGVKVYVAGKPYDFSAFRRGQTARFKIADNIVKE